MNTYMIPLLFCMPSHTKILPDLLKLARVEIPANKFISKKSLLPGVSKLIFDSRGLSIELTSYERSKTISIDVERAPVRTSMRPDPASQKRAILESLKAFAQKHSVFSGKYPILQSFTESAGGQVAVLEEEPFGIDTSGRTNRVCCIQNSKSGLVDSIIVQFDRQYIAPKSAPTLNSIRTRFPTLRGVAYFANDLILWVPEDYLRPNGSITRLVLCYDVVTTPMEGGRALTIHTYYDLVTGKKIGRLDPRTFRQIGR